MKVRHAARRPVRIEMLPLIDIVFLLLVFFIYAMLSMAVHRGLPVVLPESTAAALDRRPVVSLTLQADGSLYVDRRKTAIDDLAAVLRVRTAGREAEGVLLFADREVSYQALFRVMDRVRQAGLTQISLQAEAEPEARP